MVEHLSYKQVVGGSSPFVPKKQINRNESAQLKGRAAVSKTVDMGSSPFALVFFFHLHWNKAPARSIGCFATRALALDQRPRFIIFCGYSSMVEFQSSKLTVRVRVSLSAFNRHGVDASTPANRTCKYERLFCYVYSKQISYRKQKNEKES